MAAPYPVFEASSHGPGTGRRAAAFALILLMVGGCDHGLKPPAEITPGAIHGIVRYTGDWPPGDEVFDLRFVAMRFVPRDTSDFLQLNLMAISQGLSFGVDTDTFDVGDVEPGVFVYSGIAQQFTSSVLSWKPIGLYTQNDGIFDVKAGETTELEILVDFRNPPVFPPPGF